LSSDYPPKTRGMLYSISGDGSKDEDWLEWIDGYELDIPKEDFNSDHVANAPFIADWREHDGYFYCIYAGRSENKSYLGRGDNKIALARSKDLVQWEVP
jgi:hypothetical protein